MSDAVDAQFGSQVQAAVRECIAIGYRPTYFLQMLDEHGAIETARRLVSATTVSDGFTRLWELSRLDLTVEALMLRPEFEVLFSPTELRAASRRLAEYGFDAQDRRNRRETG